GSLEFYGSATDVANDIALNQSLGLYVNSGLITNLGGDISGGGAGKNISKTGEGTLKLSGANTFIGGTYLNDGTLELANNSALGNSGNNLIINDDDTTVDYDDGVTI